jgi:ribosome-binding protein aMBF1 (putative translation factor)
MTRSDTTEETPGDTTSWFGADAATFGDRLAAAREQSGLSQGEVAKRLGVRVSTLRSWEDDHSEPRANRLSILAGMLNVSMMWLINGDGEGLDAPNPDGGAQGDIAAVLTDIRTLRAEMLEKAETLGQLEKRLRRLVLEPVDA